MKTSLDTHQYCIQAFYYICNKMVQLKINSLWPLCNFTLPFWIKGFSTSGTSSWCSPCQAFNVFICHKRLLATERNSLQCVTAGCSLSSCLCIILKVCRSFVIIKSKYSVDNYPITSYVHVLNMGTLFLTQWVWTSSLENDRLLAKSLLQVWEELALNSLSWFPGELMACH